MVCKIAVKFKNGRTKVYTRPVAPNVNFAVMVCRQSVDMMAVMARRTGLGTKILGGWIQEIEPTGREPRG